MVLKRRFFYALILISALSILASGATAHTAVGDYVRLHVLADDDSDDAQALKLEVRDACLDCARDLLADCAGADEAWRIVNENLDALSQAAQARARARGYDGPVRAETGIFDFPDRQYGDVTVPAGKYRALRVVIGSGQGHNWWCVLYPSLCLPEDYEPGEPVRFYSSIYRWIENLIGGEEK